MDENHISDHDLERYYLGQLTREEELAPLEEHLLECRSCVKRAEETQDYVDLVRRSIIQGNYDLDGFDGTVKSGVAASRAHRALRRPRRPARSRKLRRKETGRPGAVISLILTSKPG